MPRSLKLLQIEESPEQVAATVRALEDAGFSVGCRQVRDETDLCAALEDRWDLVISAYTLSSLQGLAALEIVKRRDPRLPMMFVCEDLGQERAVEAVRAGACHCLSRSSLSRLGQAVNQALDEAEPNAGPPVRGAANAEELMAERIDAASRLAGIVAHDLNNMLTVIKGYAGLVLDVLPEDAPARKDVTAIEDAASSAEDLTRRLLAFSRREPAEIEVLGVNEVLRELEKTLRPMLGGDVELCIDLGEDLWPVQMDRMHLQQIVINLTANACEAMPWGGRLTIATRNTGAPVRGGDDRVTLSISDTGRGMSDEVRREIFEPFFTTKRSGRGAGLGLSTAYAFVKQANGLIQVFTEPGQGARFEIVLPRHV